MRIMLITDAWTPQVNGVVRTMKRVITECEALGHEWEVISPQNGFFTIPLPTYSEIKLAIGAKGYIERRFDKFEPDAVHIATEGTLGMAGRAVCLENKHPFTTSYHTRFPEYVAARFPISIDFGYRYVRWFHKYSGKVMVATPSMRKELMSRGFINVQSWTRGVDTELFHPKKRKSENSDGDMFSGLQRPVFLNVGRVAIEKNIEAFLELDLPGTKVVIGDGPYRESLKQKYPSSVFLGHMFGEELATAYASSDVFVFPSLTDTFGLVILEAMASGTPVAAYKAPGPMDIIPSSKSGVISNDLRKACLECLDLSRDECRTFALQYSWTVCAEAFIENLAPLPAPERRRFWQKIRLRRRKKVEEPA